MAREQLIKELQTVFTAETSPDLLKTYHVDNPVLEEHKPPLCAVKPGSVDELQSLMRMANVEKLGLVPVSSGAPHVKGGTACPGDHAVVDLSGWKNISWVNRRNRVCMVEPGVTFGELNDNLRSYGMTLPTTLAPRDGKSVLAAMVDREPHIWPRMHWDMQDPVASTEFIYGTGELFRSGAAGGPGSLEDQRKSGGAQKMPMGPGQTDFQRVLIGSQGSMGIMTWITLRTELLPSIERPMIVGSVKPGNIIEYIYEVQRSWLGEQSFVLNRTAAAMLMTRNSKGLYDKTRNSLPEYICLQNIAGFERLPEERLKYQLDEIRDMAGGNSLSLDDSAGEIEASGLLEASRSTCGTRDWRHVLMGNCLSVFFMSLLNKSEKYISLVRETARGFGIGEERIGIYLQPVVQNHACHMEFLIPYDPGNEAEVGIMKKFESGVTGLLMESKAFFSRPYGTAARTVFKNNPVNTELIRISKDLFDPGYILNPGKFSLGAQV